MADQNAPPGLKRMPLDKIFEAMTADIENSSPFTQFGLTSQLSQSQNQTQSRTWTDYATNPHFLSSNSSLHSNTPLANLQASQPLFMQDITSSYGDNTNASSGSYLPAQRVNHLGINENNDLIGTVNVGGGNYINVIYGNASQIMVEQQQRQCNNVGVTSFKDQEYGLFNTQSTDLIDNLVGNWVPNQSGTYSPFGGSPNVTPVPQISTSESKEIDELPRNSVDSQQKKPRIVAEVKPMRPSYSDVLAKSIPTQPSATAPLKPKNQENAAKKVLSKNSKNKSKTTSLKRQNSSGSDDHGSPKIQVSKKSSDNANSSNLPRRWVSLDNLNSVNNETPLEVNNFDRNENNLEKKKSGKSSSAKKNDKGETLNNTKVQNTNSKNNASNLQKRPIQINNNLNITNSFSQTVTTDSKVEKNQQSTNGSKFKEEKKLTKDRSSKSHFQSDKIQQIRKGQRIRKKENKDSTFKEIYKAGSKYFYRWSKVILKVFFWLLHLISDVVCMSANLFIQLGKCAWYHIILYLKYSWSYIVTASSKIRILNAFGKKIDTWFGDSKFAFWRRLKTKAEDKEETNTSWIKGSLENNISLPSTGEEAMKRLLACKGKDPYSILGVTPTCTDDDIKKYYKRQAFLVHPDKNNQPGAEEAFKILVHAFDIIGEPERRQAFDQTRQVEAAWGELSDLISQLHRKMEQAANTIRCTNCGLRHKRIPTQRPCYAARFCAQCKIRHSAKEGDIWAESRVMGFLWHYYACMEGAVYDVTDWAACQAGNLKHLKANTHIVQYRIVLGQRPPPHTTANSKKRQNDANTRNAEFEDFLNNLYNNKPGSSNSNDQNTMKNDSRRRKTKRKK